MIPYFQWQSFGVGPVVIQVWGLFVALGMLLGLYLSYRQALRRGLDAQAMSDAASWALLWAIVGGRLLYVLAYDIGLLAEPLSIFRIWDGGMSALGGFLGGGLSFFVFCRRRCLPALDYLNAAAYGLPWGYAVGRIGCFLIHDHPGIASGAWLAVNFPGGPRLDLGLFHAFLGLAIGLAFWRLEKAAAGRPVPYLALFLIIYGFGRLALDFLRSWDPAVSDARLWGLTPAQILSLPMVFAGSWLLDNPPHRTVWQKAKCAVRRLRDRF